MPVLDGSPTLALPPGRTVIYEVTFTETGGAHAYAATIPVPAGATVLDTIFRNTALWGNGTSASLVVGDGDDADGYITATDVKSAPAADTNGAGQGISTRLSLGASAGAYKGGGGKYYAAAGTITATITTGAGAQTDGRSRLLVEIALPGAPIAAAY